jgi:hypothetical protein
MDHIEDLPRPISEGRIKISKASGPDLDALMVRVRPTIPTSEIPIGILLSMICSNSGKASAALVSKDLLTVRSLIEEQVSFGLRALLQLEQEMED